MSTKHAKATNFEPLTDVSDRGLHWYENCETTVSVLASVRREVNIVEHVWRTTIPQRGNESTRNVDGEVMFVDLPKWARRKLQLENGVSRWQ